MRPEASLSRRGVLLIAIISPALLGSQFKCVAVSNPSVASARMQLEPTALRVGDVMQATGSGTGTPPLKFAWDFGDGAQAAGSQAAHVYTAPGSYLVTLTVRDALGHRAVDSSSVVVSARVAALSSFVLVSDAVAGQPVVFTALPLEEVASDQPHTYLWMFSDGQSATGPEVAAIFPQAGVYHGFVVVTNDLDVSAGREFTFQVEDAVR